MLHGTFKFVRYSLRQAALGATFTALFTPATAARAESHEYYNMYRSSTTSNVFVTQSVEGEYGVFKETVDKSSPSGSAGSAPSTGATGLHLDAASGSQAPGGASTQAPADSVTQNWQGYGLKTGVGVELHKFVRFYVAHTFVNLQKKGNSLENMRGSRLTAAGDLLFSGPLFNLQIGGGMLGSSMSYQKSLDTAIMYGSGYFGELGGEIFLSSHIAVFANASMNQEHFIKDSGTANVNSIDSSMTSLSLGLSIWL